MAETPQTLGELVTENPDAARVLHQYGLDYCCGGSRSLERACAAEGLDPAELLAAIEAATTTPQAVVRWDEKPIGELVQHILDRYHTPLKRELPRLVELAGRVESAHHDNPERPTGLASLLADIQTSVESHLGKEEQILFPLILSGRGHAAHMPIQMMLREHEDHGQNLAHIRTLTDELRIPESACPSWRELYRALSELEIELMDHIHLENNILFPRALNG